MNVKYLYFLLMFLYLTINTFASPLKLKVFYYDRLPYYGNINGKVDGILVDIAKEIFNEAGIEYEFEYTSSIRVLENLKNQDNSCALGWFKTKEREAIYDYSEEYIYQDKPYTIIINKEKINRLPQTPKIEDILSSKLVLGLVERYVYGEWLDKKIIEFKPKTTRTNVVVKQFCNTIT